MMADDQLLQHLRSTKKTNEKRPSSSSSCFSDLILPPHRSVLPLPFCPSPPPPLFSSLSLWLCELGCGLVSGLVLLAGLQPGSSSVGAGGGAPVPPSYTHAHRHTHTCTQTQTLTHTHFVFFSPNCCRHQPISMVTSMSSFWISAHV